MIKESKKFIFKKLSIALEDTYFDKLLEQKEYKNYGSVIALSYKKFDFQDFSCKEKQTAIIDLKQNLDEIFSKFSDTTRNEIRKTERNKELSFIQNDLNHKELFVLYKDFEFAQNRVPIKKDQFKSNIMFSGYYKNKIISAVSVTKIGNKLRIRSIFSKRLKLKTDNKELYKLISNASRRIVWEVCKWGKDNGFELIDMASVNMNNPITKSIAKFKMSFGGELVKEYTYIYKSKTFTFFERFVGIKHFLVRLLRRLRFF